MGDVYLAQRVDGVFTQYVALKMIREGMDTQDVHRRFQTERQILAALNHPHIARLLDGGVTKGDGSSPAGQSYLVMEYVEGEPITQYCDSHRLSVIERLRLFQTVCETVHYAHQNLIVHRDLKPSNILVKPAGAGTEGTGTIKLLDFGIAKILNPNLPGYAVAVTQTAQRIMTPAYASPEQVRGEVVTTASDVYSLGVLLYELLTGHRPYQLDTKAVHEIHRIICEEEPPRPSHIITHTLETVQARSEEDTVTPASISAARQTSVDRLRRSLEGDLDNIVLKALRKAPQRRYASAQELAVDLQRHLDGLPVLARRDTLRYRTQKFMQRHRVGVLAGTLVLLSLVGGLGAALWQGRVAQAEGDRARAEGDRANAVTRFMIDLFKEADPFLQQADTLNVYQLLDRGNERLKTELIDQPEIRTSIQSALGEVYVNLGQYNTARDLFEQTVSVRESLHGVAHRDVASSLDQLGLTYIHLKVYDKAKETLTRTQAIRRAELGSDHPAVAQTLYKLGLWHQYQEYIPEAKANYQEARTIYRKHYGDAHREIGAILNNLAIIHMENDAWAEAEAALTEALGIHREVLGEAHPDVAANLQNLANLLRRRGAYTEAEPLYRQALAIQEKHFPPTHFYILSNLRNLGALHREKGEYAEAEPLYRTVLERHRQSEGHQSTGVANAMNSLALLLADKGEYAEAITLEREVVELFRAINSPRHPRVGIALHNLATILRDQGTYAEAGQRYEEAFALFRGGLPEEHRRIRRTLIGLGSVRLMQNDITQATPLLEEGYARMQTAYPDGHWRLGDSAGWLGRCYMVQGRYAEAEPLLREAVTALETGRGPAHLYTRQAKAALEALHAARDKSEPVGQ